jgi:hypothetical protein
MSIRTWVIGCLLVMVNGWTDANADALSQPAVCSTRDVMPENTGLDFDDKKAVEDAWSRTGRGCQAFLEKKGRRHLFMFQDAAPSHGWQKKTVRPIRLGEYDFIANVYNNRFLAPAIELQPGDILHLRALDCLGPLPQGAEVHQHGQSLREDGRLQNGMALCEDLGLRPAPADAPYNLHTHGLIVSPRNSIRNRPDQRSYWLYFSCPFRSDKKRARQPRCAS